MPGRSRSGSRSRSRSPAQRRERDRRERDGRDRGVDRDRDRYRDRDRDRRRDRLDRDRDRPPRPRSRSRERRRSRSRSRERRRSRTRSRDREVVRDRTVSVERTSGSASRPEQIVQQLPQLTDADFEGKSADEVEMMKVMGFAGFNTTKGKKVEGNDQGAVHVVLKRKYRQYMNRRGGFNRPLDFVL